ncbi:erythromycin esterase family protein [Hymenobacter rigui]|uniref:Erythromycin esterase family protein n=1 Tax=Hymenobacter rigui TaxID=334424 RepID=A0A3R9P5W1_9BACT|nr:erythromycin esterase family protein [Hymenobacter rigui]RSK50932.1 erythromycin esterase family protein [Hymenobacter rigui]
MKTLFRSLVTATLLAAPALTASAQAPSSAAPATAADTARILLNPTLINAVNTQSFEQFRETVRPLVARMAGKKVVALGEGTHGTAEFYKLRFWLTRILMEEHGFTQVALENTYGGALRVDAALHQRPAPALKPLMQKHLLSIWQNQETAEMLTWMQAYNRQHRRQQVSLTGIDAMFGSDDALLVQEGLSKQNPALRPHIEQLLKSTAFQDAMWLQMNSSSFKFDRKAWLSNGLAGYDAAEQLLKALPTARLPRATRETLDLTLQNSRMVFDYPYQVKFHKRESSRDSLFAAMTQLLVRQPGSKVVVWSHDAHLSRQSMDPTDNNGGGTGAFLERMFPGQYFVLATSTAYGTFAATPQAFVSPVSPMAAYPLPAPKAGSWEISLAQVSSPAFFFNTHQLGPQDAQRPQRLVGQTPTSTEQYGNYQLSKAYDALLFLRTTTAATPL